MKNRFWCVAVMVIALFCAACSAPAPYQPAAMISDARIDAALQGQFGPRLAALHLQSIVVNAVRDEELGFFPGGCKRFEPKDDNGCYSTVIIAHRKGFAPYRIENDPQIAVPDQGALSWWEASAFDIQVNAAPGALTMKVPAEWRNQYSLQESETRAAALLNALLIPLERSKTWESK